MRRAISVVFTFATAVMPSTSLSPALNTASSRSAACSSVGGTTGSRMLMSSLKASRMPRGCRMSHWQEMPKLFAPFWGHLGPVGPHRGAPWTPRAPLVLLCPPPPPLASGTFCNARMPSRMPDSLKARSKCSSSMTHGSSRCTCGTCPHITSARKRPEASMPNFQGPIPCSAPLSASFSSRAFLTSML
eukprot:9493021-Pyramimonas_sp.AAC.1